MKILILQDRTIPASQAQAVTNQLTAFYKKFANHTLEFVFEQRDFSILPERTGEPGVFDTLPRWFINDETVKIYRRYAEEIDGVVFWVDRQHWRDSWRTETGTRVWGENFSNIFSGYQVQICRFDTANLANSFGTLYHELHHSHDAFIYKYTGVRIEQYVKVKNWDSDVTHGGAPGFDYIRHQENAHSLRLIGPFLTEAVEKRRETFRKEKLVPLLRQAIELAQRLLILKRSRQKVSPKCEAC